MNKKIIIAIVIILAATLGITIYFAYAHKSGQGSSSQSQKSDQPSAYTLSINVYNATFTATLESGGAITNLEPKDLSQFAAVSFNRTHDLLSFICVGSYAPTNALSSTGNTVQNSTLIKEVSMGLIPDQYNNLTVTCKK